MRSGGKKNVLFDDTDNNLMNVQKVQGSEADQKGSRTFLVHKSRPNFPGRPRGMIDYLACQPLRSLFIPNIRTKSNVLTAVYSLARKLRRQSGNASPFLRSDYIRCRGTQSH